MITWRLNYLDGSTAEPVMGVAESIKSAKPGALSLSVFRDGAGVGTIEMTKDKPRPIFYSFHSAEIMPFREPRQDAVVFGRSTPDGSADLWTLDKQGRPVACPLELFSASTVAEQAGG